ncbi:serine/threonine-protein kinase [Streptomyces sp. NPDC096132]|uniref:serine/threonine-protein kinase n=1 Tax=Streptomyces sp. NPDC096132 TaxID=3366075 RepID=UPI0037F8EC03
MGRVWRAVDEILDRQVAVKEMRIDGLDPEDGRTRRERTLREARATARIDHPNVVRVYDVVDEGERLWIVMELVAGRSLERVMAEEGPLTPRETARVGLGLVEALRQVHAGGVLHRDIKPGNVLVERGGRVVLTDFGIAAIQDAKALTMVGMLVGSPDYMAPERISGRPQGPPSDVWSLGATLCAALAGHSPFSRDTTLATLHAVLYEEPRLPAAAGPLTEILRTLLTKDPASRPSLPDLESTLHPLAFPEEPPTRPLYPGISAEGPAESGGRPGASGGGQGVSAGGAGGSGGGQGVFGGGAGGSGGGQGVFGGGAGGSGGGAGVAAFGPGESGDRAGVAAFGSRESGDGQGVSGGGPGESGDGEGVSADGPGVSGGRPGFYGGGPGVSDGGAGVAGGELGESADGPGVFGAPPGGCGASPGGSGAPPGVFGAPPGGSGAPPGVFGAPPGGSGAPPGVFGAPPGGSGASSAGSGVPSAGSGATSAGSGDPSQVPTEKGPGLTSRLRSVAVPAGPARRRSSRRGRIVVGVGGVAVGIVVAVVLVVAPGSGEGDGRAAGGSSAEGAPTPSAGGSNSPTVEGTSRPPSLPPGAHQEAGGFAWATPKGWRRDVQTGAEVHYTSPDGTQELVAKSSLARGDLMDTWRTSEQNAHEGRDYRKIRLEETTFRGRPAVVWEYTFTLQGTRWHARLLGFDQEGKSYQINTWYQPEAEADALKTYDKVKESFTVW